MVYTRIHTFSLSHTDLSVVVMIYLKMCKQVRDACYATSSSSSSSFTCNNQRKHNHIALSTAVSRFHFCPSHSFTLSVYSVSKPHTSQHVINESLYHMNVFACWMHGLGFLLSFQFVEARNFALSIWFGLMKTYICIFKCEGNIYILLVFVKYLRQKKKTRMPGN